jgi:hypothetical protein
MPTRRQRRRREKEHRHEYEIVWEDAEGNELEPKDDSSRNSRKQVAAQAGRSGRSPRPPSWRRTLKRGLIFAPIMYVTVIVLTHGVSRAEQITQTALIVAIFIPFSYLLDGLFWRAQKRRADREHATGKRGS